VKKATANISQYPYANTLGRRAADLMMSGRDKLREYADAWWDTPGVARRFGGPEAVLRHSYAQTGYAPPHPETSRLRERMGVQLNKLLQPGQRSTPVNPMPAGTASLPAALSKLVRKQSASAGQPARKSAQAGPYASQSQLRTLANAINQAEFSGKPPRATNSTGQVYIKTPIKHNNRGTTHGRVHHIEPSSAFAYVKPEQWNPTILAQLASNVHRHGSPTLRDAVDRFVHPSSPTNHYKIIEQKLPGWLDTPGKSLFKNYQAFRKRTGQ